MKYFPKLAIYKASNVTYEPATFTARSYNHWQFCKVIEGQLIFNTYPYSNTTRRHISKVRDLVASTLNVNNITFVEFDLNLQHIDKLTDVYYWELVYAKRKEEEREERRIERNRRARERRQALRA